MSGGLEQLLLPHEEEIDLLRGWMRSCHAVGMGNESLFFCAVLYFGLDWDFVPKEASSCTGTGVMTCSVYAEVCVYYFEAQAEAEAEADRDKPVLIYDLRLRRLIIPHECDTMISISY